MRLMVYRLVISGIFCALAAKLPAAEPLIRLDLAGRTLEGTPLAWSEKKVFFLARDGQLAEWGRKAGGVAFQQHVHTSRLLSVVPQSTVNQPPTLGNVLLWGRCASPCFDD